jgi:SAM-dependent methyltransferase
MSIFKKYSEYYDLLYSGKNYSDEVEYIISLLREYACEAESLLNLGCGTGRHDYLFAEKGYCVTGIDFSKEMVAIARSKLKASKIKNPPSFKHADVRRLKLNKEFDVVISLFHVMSYQTTNTDIRNTFRTAFEHVKEGGVFIFDCWYGPAVLTERPYVRELEVENDIYSIKRRSTPTMHVNENCVDVEFEINILNKKTRKNDSFKENHKLRYLFYPEVELFCEQAGFQLMGSESWVDRRSLSLSSWNAVFVCKKVKEK